MGLISNYKNICKFSILALAMLFISVPLSLWAQPATIPFHKKPFEIAPREFENIEARTVLGFSQTVQSTEAPWIQLHFSDYNLGERSYITITSLEDSAQQRLDAETLQQWQGSSAYFNGGAVDVKLHIAPGEKGIFIKVDEMTVGERVDEPIPESLCGPDNRVSSSDPAIGRVMPVGCTGWIVSNGAYLTAGHCDFGGLMQTLEFNVPASDPDGTPNFPPPEHQYQIVAASINSTNGGVGNDWAVFDCLQNTNTGLLPVHAQGAFYRMTRDESPANVRITGFGVDSTPAGTTAPLFRNADSQTQQTQQGPFVGETVTGPSAVNLEYIVDTTGGNSGSPVPNTASGLTNGIHTHGGCNPGATPPIGNLATSFENDNLENAIQTFPGPNVIYADKDHPIALEDGTVFRPFDTIGEAVTAVPAGGIVSIVTGSYDETLTINKAMTLTAPVGIVNIGSTGTMTAK